MNKYTLEIKTDKESNTINKKLTLEITEDGITLLNENGYALIDAHNVLISGEFGVNVRDYQNNLVAKHETRFIAGALDRIDFTIKENEL